MGFELYVPDSKGRRMQMGFATINAGGRLNISAYDLHKVGLTTKAVILTDAATKRIALRAPRESDAGDVEAYLPLKWIKSRTSAMVTIHGAVRRIGLEFDAVRGRHQIVEKDGMLIIGPLAELQAVAPTKLKRRQAS